VLSDEEGALVVCPVAEREFDGHRDIVTPYGFSGFASRGPVPGFDDYWRAFVEQRGYTCGYIGLNPVVSNLSGQFANDMFSYNTLFIFDLSLDTSELWGNLPGNRKRQVKNFEKGGCSYTTDKTILGAFFTEHFYSFFQDKEAPLLQSFREETLTSLLGADNVLVVGAVHDGRVEAVSLFGCGSQSADYLFNVSLPEGRHHTTPLIWYALTHYQQLKVPFLNLGGGVQEGDSIAKYKERFHAGQYPLSCLKQVYNGPLYAQLCAAKGVDHRNLAQYFPAYRIKQRIP
jgi:hypothetical protein